MFSATSKAQDSFEAEGTVEKVDLDLGASREGSRTGKIHFQSLIFSNVMRFSRIIGLVFFAKCSLLSDFSVSQSVISYQPYLKETCFQILSAFISCIMHFWFSVMGRWYFCFGPIITKLFTFSLISLSLHSAPLCCE